MTDLLKIRESQKKTLVLKEEETSLRNLRVEVDRREDELLENDAVVGFKLGTFYVIVSNL